MTLKNDEPEVKSGFFRRWSNKKIESQAEDTNAIEEEPLTKNRTAEENEIQTDPQQADVQEYKTDADMPPLDELTEESNFSDFLSPKVSEVLRKQALRKLFHLPFMNIVDGLDDYAEDYTKFEKLGDIIPHEMKRMLEREKAKELEEKELEEKELEEKELEEKEQQDIKDADDLRADGLQDIESENDDLDDDADFDEEYENEENSQLASMNASTNDTLSTDELINLKDKHENEKLN